VHIRAWQSAYRGLLPDEHLDNLSVQERAARFRRRSDAPDAPSTIVAIEDGAITGFATVGPSRDADARACGELYALYVDPASSGRGLGRLLLSRALARLRERGCREAILWVLVGNEPAQRFYRADGWALDGAQRWEDVYGVSSNVIRYRRTL
jgi:GNAT superfamily N-acetyltransferase